MTEEDILFISSLIEPQIVETCHQTEEELLEHLQLDHATAYKAVTLALQNIIIGRNTSKKYYKKKKTKSHELIVMLEHRC